MTYYRRNLLVLSFTIFLAAFSWEQIAPFLPLFLKDLGITQNLPFWSGRAVAIWRASGRQSSDSVGNASTVNSVSGLPRVSVTVPLISVSLLVKTTLTFCSV
jgi:hypothetical protein